MKSKDGNLISFSLLIDSKGNLVTELKTLPTKCLPKVFKESDLPLVKKVLKDVKPKLEGLHEFLEKELQSYITT